MLLHLCVQGKQQSSQQTPVAGSGGSGDAVQTRLVLFAHNWDTKDTSVARFSDGSALSDLAKGELDYINMDKIKSEGRKWSDQPGQSLMALIRNEYEKGKLPVFIKQGGLVNLESVTHPNSAKWKSTFRLLYDYQGVKAGTTVTDLLVCVCLYRQCVVGWGGSVCVLMCVLSSAVITGQSGGVCREDTHTAHQRRREAEDQAGVCVCVCTTPDSSACCC
jgi:hypothetical protein